MITRVFNVTVLIATCCSASCAEKAALSENHFATMTVEEGAVFLRQLADKGDADAQYALGIATANGFGLPQDYSLAFKLYGMAAVQGNAEAQRSLMFSYHKGFVVSFGEHKGFAVTRNAIVADMWCILAENQGVSSSKLACADIEKTMTKAERVQAKKLVSEWVPIPSGIEILKKLKSPNSTNAD